MTRLVIVANSIEELGGAQRVVHVLAQGLALRGFDVDLVGIAPASHGHRYVDEPAFRSTTLMGRPWPPPPSERPARPWRRADARTRNERDALRAEAAAGLSQVLHDGESGVVICAQLWAMELLTEVDTSGWPVIGQYHSSFEAAAGGRDLGRITSLYPDIARFLLLTPQDAERFRRLGMNNTGWMPNPLAVWPADPATPERSRTVLYLGRLSSEKGPGFLLDAWESIADRHPDWTLRLVGSGPDEAKIRARVDRMAAAGTSVVLDPPVADVVPVLREAGILALPSLTEGLPLSLAEAMACGLPTVSTDCSDGVRLLTLDGAAGVVVPRADPVAMGQALSALMSDARARADLGVRARAAVADYRLDPVLDRWERVIAEVLR